MKYITGSERKIDTKLDAGDWSTSRDANDADFSPDGTIVVGVDVTQRMCRLWSAGNGEILGDVQLKMMTSPRIAGMPTNTHVAIFDGRMRIVDVASKQVLATLPLGCDVSTRFVTSPRGNVMAGSDKTGNSKVLMLHNFSPIKMKSTLQRVKSFRG